IPNSHKMQKTRKRDISFNINTARSNGTFEIFHCFFAEAIVRAEVAYRSMGLRFIAKLAFFSV
ncbi:MAG: hypothetical protein WAM14_25450, partial [Candidatus Nitrosopolaris sp.]